MIEFDFDFEDASIMFPRVFSQYGRFNGTAEVRFFPDDDMYEIRSITLRPEAKGYPVLVIPLIGADPEVFAFAQLLAPSILAQIKIHDPCASHAKTFDPISEHSTRNARAL